MQTAEHPGPLIEDALNATGDADPMGNSCAKYMLAVDQDTVFPDNHFHPSRRDLDPRGAGCDESSS